MHPQSTTLRLASIEAEIGTHRSLTAVAPNKPGPDALTHRIAIGELLAEARSLHQGKGFIAWYREHVGISQTAVLWYIALASHKDVLRHLPGNATRWVITSVLMAASAKRASEIAEARSAGMKKCACCEETKGTEMFPSKGGRCKACESAAKRISWAARPKVPKPPKPPKENPTSKRCPCCGDVKPIEGFYRVKVNSLSSYCRPCQSEQARESYYRNRDRNKASRERSQTAHPEAYKAYRKARKARLKGAPVVDLTAAQWKEIKGAYKQRCAYCGKASSDLTQDHVTPLSRGGSHTASNIVPACRKCNMEKGVHEAPTHQRMML